MDIQKATPELYAALAKAQGEIENASKSSTNPHFRSKYADLAEVLNTVRPVLSAHGLCLIQSTAFDGTLVSVTTLLGHSSGGWVSSTASCVPTKTDAQGVGASTTYLRRYSAASMCGIAQEDDDGQAASHGRPPAKVAVSAEADQWIRAIAAADNLSTLSDIGSELAAADMPAGEKGLLRETFARRRVAISGRAA